MCVGVSVKVKRVLEPLALELWTVVRQLTSSLVQKSDLLRLLSPRVCVCFTTQSTSQHVNSQS